MIASIRGKKPHVYRVIILKQMADHTWRETYAFLPRLPLSRSPALVRKSPAFYVHYKY